MDKKKPAAKRRTQKFNDNKENIDPDGSARPSQQPARPSQQPAAPLKPLPLKEHLPLKQRADQSSSAINVNRNRRAVNIIPVAVYECEMPSVASASKPLFPPVDQLVDLSSYDSVDQTKSSTQASTYEKASEVPFLPSYDQIFDAPSSSSCDRSLDGRFSQPNANYLGPPLPTRMPPETESKLDAQTDLEQDVSEKLYYSKEHMELLLGFSEYIEDIIHNLSKSEDDFELSYAFMSKYRAIKSTMRKVVVNWLISIQTHVDAEMEVLYHCLSILDRFTDEELQLKVTEYQLAGTAAMLIAAKMMDEVSLEKISVSNLLYFTKNSYTPKQLTEMERRIMKCLEFRLMGPIPSQFLCYFFLRLGIAEESNFALGYYAIDAVLVETLAAKAKPSLLAISACYVTYLTVYHLDIKFENLDNPCYYREVDLLPLAYTIMKCLLNSKNPESLSHAAYKKHRVAIEKYYGNTSNLEPHLKRSLSHVQRRKQLAKQAYILQIT